MYRSLYLIVIAAIAAGCSPAPPVPAGEGSAAVAVNVASVAREEWRSAVEAGGVVVARETATISSRVVAPIARVLAGPGDRVKAGQTLIVLDAASLGAEAARAASVSIGAEHAARAAASELQAAEAAFALSKTTHARIAALHATRSATTQELEEAQASLSLAESRQAAAAARIAEAQAGLDAARAGRQSAAALAGYTSIASPFEGVVTSRLVDPGSLATPGAPLLVIENTTSFRLEIKVDASRAPLVTLKQTVPVRLDSADDTPWLEGRVVEISRIDPGSHAFAVKVELPPGGASRSGIFGRARLEGDARVVISVPASAILHRGQLSYVFVTGVDNIARLRAVSPGASNEGRIEILDGLSQGEVVIVSPPESLRDGTAVTKGAGR